MRVPLVKPTVISTFAGCGGSSLGYKWAGFRELLAVDFEPHAVETFRLNFPEVDVWQADMVFRGARVAVFMDGCFWHGCPECYRPPKSNGAFWRVKVEGNRERDKRQTRELEDMGWTVLRFWEHEVNGSLGSCIDRVKSAVGRD
jgi:DNA mismatch endonuclease Vsr